MTEEREDNIYVYHEDDRDTDDSPYNYAAQHPEEETEIQEESEKRKQLTPFSLLIKVMFNPVEGWKNLRRGKFEVQELQSGCFYPLLSLLALSNFADYFYSVDVTISQIITKAVISFVSFFFGYFSIIVLLKTFLPKNVADYFNQRFGQDFVILSLSTMAIFSIVINLLPMLWPILIFLPLWTIYIMYKGSKFFKMNENQTIKSVVWIFGSVIGVPVLIDWILNTLLPY